MLHRLQSAAGVRGAGRIRTAIDALNALPPVAGWVTEHLCPRDDVHYDVERDRMFYMRKNGMRIDAIREQIAAWKDAGQYRTLEEACLLAPLVYQACYRSNTSGVFKGFHNGWGGQTGTALYRIATDLRLDMPVFWDNGRENLVFREDAQALAERLVAARRSTIAYLDPPYNQHPYGSNYHVLNSVVLWDKPRVEPADHPRHQGRHPARLAHRAPQRVQLQGRGRRGLPAAAGHDQRPIHSHQLQHRRHDPLGKPVAEQRRAGPRLRGNAGLQALPGQFAAVLQKPMNVEFVLVVDTHRKNATSLDELRSMIARHEATVLSAHSSHP